MTDLKKSFIQLVRLGIGTSNEISIESCVDWEALMSLAARQGLSAIVLDGVERLPVEIRPPQELLLQYIGQALCLEQKYSIQWKIANDLALLLNKEDILVYVLKGAVISECYPKPSHRSSVDFDCFLKSGIKKTNTWEEGNMVVERKGIKVERDYYRHSTWFLPSLTVENHRWLTPFRGNKKLTELERFLQEKLCEDANVDAFVLSNLLRPPVIVSALFLIEHAYTHFLNEGLTWRHILDWMMYSRKHVTDINWQQLDSMIDAFGLRDFYESYYKLGRYLLDDYIALTARDNMMMEDVWAPLDLHESSTFLHDKIAIIGNIWRARWKYREFTEMTWFQALWIFVKGFFFDKEPKLDI